MVEEDVVKRKNKELKYQNCLNKGLNLGKVKKCKIKTEESELSN
jgi:hypothetical protein